MNARPSVYIAGLDLGRPHEFTALSVLERTEVPKPDEPRRWVRHYAVRHHVKPGLTGWAQVHGCRGPTLTTADVKRRVEFDLWYIDNWNFRLDCRIILRTFVEVLRGRNAY